MPEKMKNTAGVVVFKPRKNCPRPKPAGVIVFKQAAAEKNELPAAPQTGAKP